MEKNELNDGALVSLLTVLSYNGYSGRIREIYTAIHEHEGDDENVFCPDSLSDDPDSPDRILWSVLALEYGDYGSSPRYGWVEDKASPCRIIAEFMESEEMEATEEQ